MELLYFDFDHGMERLLFVELDREAQSVHFRFEQSPDPSHDEESAGVATVAVKGSANCSSPEQFAGFVRELVAAMRNTAFSLQDPSKTPFEAMRHELLVLDRLGEGVRPDELTCRIPPEISAELLRTDAQRDRFRALTGSPCDS